MGPTYPRLEFSLPKDVLPMGPKGAQHATGGSCPAGWALKRLADEIDAENPVLAARLRRAIDAYYPDGELELDVITVDGDRFCLHSFCVEGDSQFERMPGKLEYVPGSIDVVNYDDTSRYSRYDYELPYRIFRFWAEDDEEMCLLISDDLVLQAAMARD